jgi:3-hydroxyisobutyrate dehydrogenase-like beta-hydroxyacid dehydrogenase
MADAPAASADSIGFIGLGALGAPMAANLIRAGFPLTLHNRSREREAVLLEELGASRDTANRSAPSTAFGTATCAGSPVEAAAAVGDGIICLCLSDDDAVEAVLLKGEGAALHGLKPGALVVDFSTIAPATTRRLAQRCAAAGVRWLDAPVTGGTEGARAGSLSVLVGGDAKDLERARPLLDVVGGRITHLGPVGAGQQAKAVNQVLVAGSYAAVAEALALGQRFGLAMPQVVEALQGGAAGSWALSHRAGNMLNGHYPLGFKLALHRKDLAIALDAAAAAQLELPISERVAALEDELIALGHGDDDVSALARWFINHGNQPPQA